MVDFQQGATALKKNMTPTLDEFDIEVEYGGSWISLNDHVNYRMSANDYGTKTQTLRRVTAASPFYDGTFLVHSTQENVTEAVTIYVLGVSNEHVTENILNLVSWVSQDSYNIRVRLDDHMETWLCQPADYSIDRSQVNAHNVRAQVSLQITRLPRVTYEIVL